MRKQYQIALFIMLRLTMKAYVTRRKCCRGGSMTAALEALCFSHMVEHGSGEFVCGSIASQISRPRFTMQALAKEELRKESVYPSAITS